MNDDSQHLMCRGFLMLLPIGLGSLNVQRISTHFEFHTSKTWPLGQASDGLWELGNRPDFAMVRPNFHVSNLSETKDLGGLHARKITENYCLDGGSDCGRDGLYHSCGNQDHGADWFADQLRDS